HTVSPPLVHRDLRTPNVFLAPSLPLLLSEERKRIHLLSPSPLSASLSPSVNRSLSPSSSPLPPSSLISLPHPSLCFQETPTAKVGDLGLSVRLYGSFENGGGEGGGEGMKGEG